MVLIGTILLVLPVGALVRAHTLEVGPGKPFARIEEANRNARSGDVILVYPQAHSRPYKQVAVQVNTPGLVFRAVPADGERWVKVSGKGFNYSGRGQVPRAIFQFNRSADGCVLEGFDLEGAHGESHNAAGVRINRANHVTIRNSNIHHNDMGIKTGGRFDRGSGGNQLIEYCRIHHNGSMKKPGHSHNLYLGGTSVTLRFCEAFNSLVGQNLKSRAHYTRVEYCYLHDSANRELDLVDSASTAAPGSHAVLIGNVIVKASRVKGNAGVIHFGQDNGHEHDGTLFLVHNTIVTPYRAPVINLSAAKAKVHLSGNIICDLGAGRKGQVLVAPRHGARLKHVKGSHNWFSKGFSLPSGIGLDSLNNSLFANASRLFVDPRRHDYRIAGSPSGIIGAGQPLSRIVIPPVPGARQTDEGVALLTAQYLHPANREERHWKSPPDLGAYGTSLR